MSDQNQFVDENPAGFNNEPAGDYKEYSGPTQASETPKTDPEKAPSSEQRSFRSWRVSARISSV